MPALPTEKSPYSRPRALLYVGDVVPGPGYGGPIIVDRHLRRFAAEGWAVTVVCPRGHEITHGPWLQIQLPLRRWWWPPFRPTMPRVSVFRSAFVRHYLVSSGLLPPQNVLTVVTGNYSWLAADLARAWRAPLFAIVHDWWEETGSPTERLCGEYVCRQARRVLTVCPEMSEALAPVAPNKTEVLPPIPAARELPFAVWRGDYGKRPVVAHVGSLHPHHIEFLARTAQALAHIGGELLVVCPAANSSLTSLRRQSANIRHQDYFPTNIEALKCVATHASAVVIMYPHGEGVPGRPPTGFPSRFIEFIQLGLPVLLVAPPTNPVRTWGLRSNWQAAFSPDDQQSLSHFLPLLAHQPDWERLAMDSRMAASSMFDPNSIHHQLSSLLATR